MREQCMLVGAVFVAVSIPAEHRRIGKHACIMLSRDMLIYRNGATKKQERSPNDSLFFKHMHGSALNGNTQTQALKPY